MVRLNCTAQQPRVLYTAGERYAPVKPGFDANDKPNLFTACTYVQWVCVQQAWASVHLHARMHPPAGVSTHLDLLINVVVRDEVASKGPSTVALSLVERLGAGIQQVAVVGDLAGELVLSARCGAQKATGACQPGMMSADHDGPGSKQLDSMHPSGSLLQRVRPLGRAGMGCFANATTCWPACSLCMSRRCFRVARSTA